MPSSFSTKPIAGTLNVEVPRFIEGIGAAGEVDGIVVVVCRAGASRSGE